MRAAPRPTLLALVLVSLALAGCADESTCRESATPPVARLSFGESQPTDEQVRAALESRGWTLLEDGAEGGWLARTSLSGELVAHARYLDVSEEGAPGLLVTTSEPRATDVQAEQTLAPVVEPLEDALEEQVGQPIEAVYRAGATECP